MVTPVRALHHRIQRMGRWPQRVLAAVLGFVGVFAMPPVYQVYLLIPALSGFLWLVDGAKTRRQAFFIGWFFGAGFFAGGLYWTTFALLVEAEKFAWLVPFAIIGFAFGLGLFMAVAAVVVRQIGGALVVQVLTLAAVWAFLEWVRAWIFTGLPWNPMGSVWAFSDAMVQIAAHIGVFGLSLVTVWAAASFAALVQGDAVARRTIGVSVSLLVALGVYGQWRLSTSHTATVDDVRLRLVQPNIAQGEKWQRDLRSRNMGNQLDLAIAAPKPGEPFPTHIIWAETAAPFFIANSDDWRRVVGQATPPGGLTILGAPRVLEKATAGAQMAVANALLAIDEQGAITGAYDKFHLVPFGEYVPLSDWLALDKITQGLGAFTPGPGLQTLSLKGLPPVSPLICYEVIFPGAVTQSGVPPEQQAQWLLNLTNDAWYGETAGPHQHFVTARFRAVEEGLPTVRVAWTGISGVIDGYGRVTARLGLGQRGFIDADLPRPAATPGLYRVWGNGVPLALAGLVLAGGLVLRRAYSQGTGQ